MSRYMGSIPLEYYVYKHIIKFNPDLNLSKHPRGWPAIDLPNPDAVWETHQVFSTRTYVWIRSVYSQFTQGSIVLTETEVKQVASLLAGVAYMNSPPPLALPLEPTAKYEPLLEATVSFMHHILKKESKVRYDNTMKDFQGELIKVAVRLGLSQKSIPKSTPWLGRIMKLISSDLHSCGIEAGFYRNSQARYVSLTWVSLPPPLIDGKDSKLTASAVDAVRHNELSSRLLGPTDGNDGEHQELAWNSLEPKGPSEP